MIPPLPAILVTIASSTGVQALAVGTSVFHYSYRAETFLTRTVFLNLTWTGTRQSTCSPQDNHSHRRHQCNLGNRHRAAPWNKSSLTMVKSLGHKTKWSNLCLPLRNISIGVGVTKQSSQTCVYPWERFQLTEEHRAGGLCRWTLSLGCTSVGHHHDRGKKQSGNIIVLTTVDWSLISGNI